jgi:hypothetical protein
MFPNYSVSANLRKGGFMSERIDYSAAAAVVGGPRLSFSAQVAAEAYDKLQFEIEHSATHAVNIGTSANKVQLLAVKASNYGDLLTVAVGTATHKVNGPLLVVGSGTIAMLLGDSPAQFTFSNGLLDKVTIDVLIARDAT